MQDLEMSQSSVQQMVAELQASHTAQDARLHTLDDLENRKRNNIGLRGLLEKSPYTSLTPRLT